MTTDIDMRQRILELAATDAKAGLTVSLDSVARRADLTKAGVMHYFRTKEAMMLGLLDLVAGEWEANLTSALGRPIEESDAESRVRAFVGYALEGHFDDLDLVMYSDPRLRAPLLERWGQYMTKWFELPEQMPSEQRARFLAARLIAEGAWLAAATHVLVPSAADRAGVRKVAQRLMEAPDA